jgi:prepilin-type processing-associated H-X9-DG protein
VFPTGWSVSADGNYQNATWIALMKPNLEQQNTTSESNIKTLICPSDKRQGVTWSAGGSTYGLTFYAAASASRDYLNDGIIVPTTSPGHRIADVTDGLTNTIIVAERPPSPDVMWGWWGEPTLDDTFTPGRRNNLLFMNSGGSAAATPPCPRPAFYGQTTSPDSFCSFQVAWSNHSGGANMLMGDGSVRFLSYSAGATIANATTGQTLIEALITRAGNEPNTDF